MKHLSIARGLVAMLGVYRRFVSPALAPRCRFRPSCSEYAAEAISRHGAVKGLALAGTRLVKCHPFHPGGFDLVPEKYRICDKRRAGASGSHRGLAGRQ